MTTIAPTAHIRRFAHSQRIQAGDASPCHQRLRCEVRQINHHGSSQYSDVRASTGRFPSLSRMRERTYRFNKLYPKARLPAPPPVLEGYIRCGGKSKRGYSKVCLCNVRDYACPAGDVAMRFLFGGSWSVGTDLELQYLIPS